MNIVLLRGNSKEGHNDLRRNARSVTFSQKALKKKSTVLVLDNPVPAGKLRSVKRFAGTSARGEKCRLRSGRQALDCSLLLETHRERGEKPTEPHKSLIKGGRRRLRTRSGSTLNTSPRFRLRSPFFPLWKRPTIEKGSKDQRHWHHERRRGGSGQPGHEQTSSNESINSAVFLKDSCSPLQGKEGELTTEGNAEKRKKETGPPRAAFAVGDGYLEKKN